MKRFGYPTFRHRCMSPTWSDLFRADLGLDERTARIGPCWLNHARVESRAEHMLLDCDEARRLRVLELLQSLRRQVAA